MENTDQKPINTNGEGRPSMEAMLNYIDKVCAEQNRVGSASNRVSVVQLAVSLLLLFAAAGLVSTQGDVTLLGLGLRASCWRVVCSYWLV